eukprot:TRINITY_DN66633_c8_g2_i2.p2 TRINITY_DN66633_c8_g2~~TRINITY_DN66633_c8_g2_i2.p2  ORF type:complete len:162 (-),score=11.08 TRINITY_DN66633_c8_g2_i2:111-596(-)
MSDHFKMHTELTLWLWENYSKKLGDLDNNESAEYFAKFATQWNTASLPKKYYKGIHSSELDPSTRTSYRWGFVDKVDAMELAMARDTVDTDTYERGWSQLPKEYRKKRETDEDKQKAEERREKFQRKQREEAEADPFSQRQRWKERKEQREKEERVYGGAM